ncbi:GGDEF domain-containing protein [Shewanella sp. VB17]|uniref:GGDEF domain-containing protein n=1 Tax=Shewanella sp. VB17 TaxID=2739432 RepID=UPI0015652730|nr:GGDEF domain-containing protein [Shewanella sp. VB17]NRD72433.1 GGDEF domain-containing protein [Shewanella sp. VB17]
MRVLVLIFSLYSIQLFANEPESGFSRSLKIAEAQLYSLPIKARVRLIEMETVELKEKQPAYLLIRYFVLKAKVSVLLNEPVNAIQAAEKGMTYTQNNTEFKAEQFQLKLSLSQALLLQGKSKIVLDQLNHLLQEVELFNDPETTAEFLLVKGKAYRDKEEYDTSMAALMSSLEIANQSNDEVLLTRISSDLAEVLLHLNGFDKAELLLEKSYRFFKKRKMSFNLLLIKMDMAKLAKKRGEDKKAIEEYLQALTLAQVLGDGFHRFRINLHIAELLLNTGEIQRMKPYLLASQTLSKREHSRYYISKFNLLRVNELLINHKYQEAIDLISILSPKLNKFKSLYHSELQLHLAASKAYYGLGDTKNAYLTLLDYQQRFGKFSADEQIDNLEKQKLLFDLEKLKAENEQLSWNNVLNTLELKNSEDEIEYLNLLIFFAIISAIAASIIAWRMNRHRIRWGEIANTDSLTKLFNRRYLSNKLLSLYKLDEDTIMSCILLDIDFFKVVNDSYGHALGDEVLVKVADLFINNVRREDICGRIGGEEFMILLPNTYLQQAVEVAEDLRIKISHLHFTSQQGTPFSITASFGVAVADKQQSFSELSNQADELLYIAKNGGRNRVAAGEANLHNLVKDKSNSKYKTIQHIANLKKRAHRLLFRFIQLIK